MQYCLYLRKSRADAEAEMRGEGETLARHEKLLLEIAKKLQLNITEIYREVVSGETIAARPVMQRLLSEVEQNVWDGVLVMEVERLARGDTVDQGIVAQTFKYSETKIITPVKTYDPSNEYDEEYFEFGLFMSRREYKTINRRLQRGRMASIKEGKYVGNTPPYGYSRIRLQNDKGWTLIPIDEEAQIVRLIFEWYTTGFRGDDGTLERLGAAKIVRRLNALGVPPRKGGKSWSVASVRDMLINPVYIGKVRWNWRKSNKHMSDGEISVSRPRSAPDETLVVPGLHPALIDESVFVRAQEYMSLNPPRPVGEKYGVTNPLAGLVVCGKCGKRMVRRPYGNGKTPSIMCADTACTNVSSSLPLVEERILAGLADWLQGYKLQWKLNESVPKPTSLADVKKKALAKKKSELETLTAQMSRTHDLLEQGIYDTDTFLERTRDITSRTNETKLAIETLEKECAIETLREESASNIVPAVEKVIELYDTLPSAAAKNDMLKEVLEKVVYLKEVRARKRCEQDNFEITLYPKIPKI